MADLQLFTKMLRYVINWGIFWRTKQSGPIPRDERGKLLSLLLEGKESQLIRHSKLWPFWSPWQEDKKIGNYNIAAKVTNLASWLRQVFHQLKLNFRINICMQYYYVLLLFFYNSPLSLWYPSIRPWDVACTSKNSVML